MRKNGYFNYIDENYNVYLACKTHEYEHILVLQLAMPMVDESLTMYLAEAGVESISWTPVTQTMLVAVCELTAHSTSPIITVAELKQNDVISNDLHT